MTSFTPRETFSSFAGYLKTNKQEFILEGNEIMHWRYLGSFGFVKVFLTLHERAVRLSTTLSHALPPGFVGRHADDLCHLSWDRIWCREREMGWATSFGPDELLDDDDFYEALLWLEREAFLAGAIFTFFDEGKEFDPYRLMGFGEDQISFDCLL